MTDIRSKKPILIVEDSVDDFEATERALQKSGNLVNPIVRCIDGSDAMNYLTGSGKYADQDTPLPELILLDLNMPGRDGRTLLSILKSDSRLWSIPVIILTTSDSEEDVSICYQLGANSYIKKPVDMTGFFYAMKRLTEYWFDVAILPKSSDNGIAT